MEVYDLVKDDTFKTFFNRVTHTPYSALHPLVVLSTEEHPLGESQMFYLNRALNKLYTDCYRYLLQDDKELRDNQIGRFWYRTINQLLGFRWDWVLSNKQEAVNTFWEELTSSQYPLEYRVVARLFLNSNWEVSVHFMRGVWDVVGVNDPLGKMSSLAERGHRVRESIVSELSNVPSLYLTEIVKYCENYGGSQYWLDLVERLLAEWRKAVPLELGIEVGLKSDYTTYFKRKDNTIYVTLTDKVTVMFKGDKHWKVVYNEESYNTSPQSVSRVLEDYKYLDPVLFSLVQLLLGFTCKKDFLNANI